MVNIEWLDSAFVFTAVGFFLVILAMAGADHGVLTGVTGAVEALEICGFVAYLGAFVLTVMLHYGQIEDKADISEPVLITYTVLSYLAVVLIVIGLGVFGGKAGRRPPPYVTTLLVCGGLLSCLGGTFGVLKLVDLKI